MRQYFLGLLILLFTTFNTPVLAEWTEVGEGVGGNIYYVDFEGVRERNGSVFYWVLQDHLRPDEYGSFSASAYYQGDCGLFRYQTLSTTFFDEPMGQGKGIRQNSRGGWDYPPPESMMESILQKVCGR
jgi:hypothetical protein